MEGFGVERRPVEVETAGEFGGEVLRIGRAATIAAKVDFSAIAQRGGNHLRRLLDAGLEVIVVEDRLLHGDGIGNGLEYSGVHYTHLLEKRRENTNFRDMSDV